MDRAHRSPHVTVFETNDAIALSMERNALKEQAQRALERLMQNRTSSQQYHDDIGQSDPLSSVTGRSAIDRAIDTTREILNDIESIQAIDTLLNSKPALSAACQQESSASSYLSEKVSNQLPLPSRSDWNRDVNSQSPNLLVVTYSFGIPGMASAIEKRVIELSPSFTTSCPLMP